MIAEAIITEEFVFQALSAEESIFGILQWYQSIILAQPVELIIYGKYEDHNAYILT